MVCRPTPRALSLHLGIYADAVLCVEIATTPSLASTWTPTTTSSHTRSLCLPHAFAGIARPSLGAKSPRHARSPKSEHPPSTTNLNIILGTPFLNLAMPITQDRQGP